MFFEENKSNEIFRKVGPYRIGETLGKGGYSWVKRGVDERTGEPVALKFLQVDKQSLNSQRKQVHSEIRSLRRIDNPYVVKIRSFDLKCKYPDKSGGIRKTFLLVLEYCYGGELFDILKYTDKLDPITARTYFIQLLKGLKACHDVGVIHRDIKPQNLLLSVCYQLKISDFGLSYLLKDLKDMEKQTMKTQCGTRGFQAPELLKGERYTKACDIFSCGVVLFILLVGYRPFEHAWREDKWYKPMCEQKPEEFWSIHKTVELDDDSRELLTGMLQYRPQRRLTLQECLEHKWVAGRKVHTTRDLIAVVKEKHVATRKKRRMDKKKMQHLQNSVTRKKGRRDSGKRRQKRQCSPSWDVSIFKVKLPKTKNFVPSLLTFFAHTSQLNEAYNAAVNVFNEAFDEKSQTVFDEKNPWEVKTLVEVSDGVYNIGFSVMLYVCEIEGTDMVAFKFRRCLGDSIAFARIWDAAEEYLLTHYQDIFLDALDEDSKPTEEIKFDD